MSTKLYDETIGRHEEIRIGPPDAAKHETWNDYRKYTVKLFKDIIVDKHIITNDNYIIYLLVEKYEYYNNSPLNTSRWPLTNIRKKTYVSGSDSDHIRKAIELIDKFKNEQ
ncbi:hypothetical protein LCGC14_1491340 [marine sediment metagenome]|uniref:Uncharacterized protein n=1 Tax=marine sediment metagenome TaxID=412755 RepID=A0A0F9M8D3_9ZZZZ